MKPRWVSIAAALAVAAACSSTHVRTNQDPAAPFGKYRTYALAEGQLVVQGVPTEHELMRDQIVGALSRELAGKGLRHDQSDPNLIVTYNARARAWEESRASWDRGLGTRIYKVERSESRIIVDVVDADTRKRVWHGTAKAKDERFRSRKFINKTVNKLMAQYPSRLPAG